ncbi:amino acid adenylation domain-containing protein [Pseudomonas sp. 148P]|uniref:Amino acid adenylation domain-containing protein n=1 Tax=Pseudomonas ulcerans TaxID=3115852 RepID=A0ABU7I1R9_9PSED|nr:MULTISPECIES: amino acid adenylation domain-containing protein [unclassified Pseudomonas]MEE1926394.1 amino acid adenylation domain-containing protein [Pseudomonas sp. 147P]MEE1937608.1 amino acid adenylation domain-containing protein [Pseudomonas sp. 148P]
MRRLDILLAGTSPALLRLFDELEQHGHSLHRLTEGSPFARPDLLIEDGSIELPDVAGCSLLSLRVGSGALVEGALPELELLYWSGTARAQRLIDRQPLPKEASGNGQALRLRALDALQERVALHVSRFSRNPEHFHEAEAIGPMRQAHEHPLPWLERLAWLHVFNRGAQHDLLQASGTPVIEMLERSLVQHARLPALNFDGQRISYAQLHAQALAIQAQLLSALDGDAPVVAVCLPKSLALYASLLAVLGCGAIYLPLDPGTPPERLRFIVRDAKATVLIHDGQFPESDRSMPELDLSQLPEPLPLSGLMRRRPTADAPCVAIYTSGTTGQPKGVLLSQRNISHFQAWYAGHVGLGTQSRALQFSTINFDASLLDIIPTWICGAELVVPSEAQRQDPAQLERLIRRQEVSHAFLPPALLSLLKLEDSSLTHLVTGGDVCEPQVIEQFAGQCHFHNIYGPTETTVLATTRVFAAGDNVRNLGVPIDDARVLLLDEARQPVPEHTAGELYIGGPGVGLGYLNNAVLSAERFITLVLPDGERLRLYRTGDLAQWTGDGIEICGRRDNQVKIRGFRVEPEEIEHCLRASRLFAQVAVVIDTQRRVLAFLAQPRRADAIERLKDHAEQHLPDYMRPLLYQALPRMPYTANGKVDRRALLDMPVSLATTTQKLVPANALERQLLGLWSELLELPAEDISTDDSFFNLGGHSILLSRLLLAIREAFGRGIPINRFIEEPTLLRLAALLSGEVAGNGALHPQAQADAERPLDLQTLPLERLGDVHKVIVTGANSFLGVHIVEALLGWGATEVACLVRRGEGISAAARFAQALADNRIKGLDWRRIRVFEANLRKPRFGLSDHDYEDLDRRYGALIHNAAQVNHVLDYPALAADNVEPLFECLRLCEGRSKKIFNFISTLSACSTRDEQGRVLEAPAAATPPLYIRNGYNLSKWVGERILERAREQGVWVNLFRPGNITFNSLSGVSQPHKNRLMLMLKGSLQLGQVPALELEFDLMPVDFLACFIGFHASRYRAAQAVFNLHNPEPLRWERYVTVFREYGQAFDLVSVASWQRELQRVDRDNALFDVLGFYLDGFEEDIGDTSLIDHANAREGVQRMGARYPEKSTALLERGCRYLREIRFI